MLSVCVSVCLSGC